MTRAETLEQTAQRFADACCSAEIRRPHATVERMAFNLSRVHPDSTHAERVSAASKALMLRAYLTRQVDVG